MVMHFLGRWITPLSWIIKENKIMQPALKPHIQLFAGMESESLA